eukprot:TRINITY_DN1709_c1_g1_i2.p1 TRINITY_DN1709_c1_g1~~TRINITY_DN1709_c1_g1_i2.p1  ORF type:complete len:278 (+),score=106.86 TRINITY_DN1709_c1_g1_i2:390-1223(+)
MRVCGIDIHGRAIAYSCFSQATHRTDVEANVEHMLWCMEDCVRVMDQYGRGAETWVWIVDYHGYSLRVDSSPSTATQCAKMLAHYPERLGRAVCVDAGWLFESTWAVVKRITNERTSSKVAFKRSSDLADDLREYCDDATIRWIQAEMAQNRQLKPPNWKKDRAAGKRWWAKPDEAGGHDPRGAPSYLESGVYQPAEWLAGEELEDAALAKAPAPAPDSDPDDDLLTAVNWDDEPAHTAPDSAPPQPPPPPPPPPPPRPRPQVVADPPATRCCCALQ